MSGRQVHGLGDQQPLGFQRAGAEALPQLLADFRRQARGWLRAELEARRRLLEQGRENAGATVADDLQQWLGNFPFAGVRGPEALARLPGPERQAWQQLWADVAATLARAQGKAPPVAKADREVQPPER
jgi:hypothetical protein